MNFRKTFFILPNLFTLSSVFCGFFAIISVASGGAQASSEQLYQAAIAICFGAFFDTADGRVARLTKTQSKLGMELDSLADVITFGVAPGMMMYRWGLSRITASVPYVGPHIGALIAFAYVGCAALRLARFNVLAQAGGDEKAKNPGKYILGLPVPVAASVLVSLVLADHQLGQSSVAGLVSDAVLAALVLVLAGLMVSRVRFRSFKDLKPSRRTITVGAAILAALFVVTRLEHVQGAIVFSMLLAVYLTLGLMEEVVFFRRRRLEAQAAAAPQSVVLEAEGGARSDEEVLEELGAYDETASGPVPLVDPPSSVAKAG